MKTHFYKEDIKKICYNNHLDVDTIFERVKKIYPKAGRSTIYRNVEELTLEGGLKKLSGIGQKAYYEGIKENHAHLVNKKTGEIIDVEIKNLDINIPENFDVENIDIRIYGE
ncbi:MAG: transcriptional repressor [Candidatus Gracilibacteria bacterium]|nr:transcriptional repressor [Candidatus Gracilibacteria bacterium]